MGYSEEQYSYFQKKEDDQNKFEHHQKLGHIEMKYYCPTEMGHTKQNLTVYKIEPDS
jgi:hypothetical protein